MKAFIEAVQWLVRVGEHAEKYGDPYDDAVAVRELDDWTCELVGYVNQDKDKRPTLEGLHAALACLARDTNYRTAIVRRIRDGREHVREYDLLKRRTIGNMAG